MSLPHLSPEELLTTTRSVRKRLDFSRPVPPEVVRECLELAVQAPTGASSESWHFVVVTDQEQRKAVRHRGDAIASLSAGHDASPWRASSAAP